MHAVNSGILTIDVLLHPLEVCPILTQVGQTLGTFDSAG